MKNIVFVLSNDKDGHARQIAHQCMQKLVLSKEFALPRRKDNTYIKIVTTEPGVGQILGLLNSTTDWLSAEEAISVLAKQVDQENVKQQRFGTVEIENLATALHEVADTLLYLGLSLDIIFCMQDPENNTLDSRSFVPLTGAVRRLVDWHNGYAVIVKLNTELSPLELQLLEFGHCQVVESVGELNLDWPGWRGKIAVVDHLENRGHVFPAFNLACDDWSTLLQQKLPSTEHTSHKKSLRAVCGRTVEVLQEVDLRTFPLFLLDSWTLDLHVRSYHSETLVQYIQSLEQAGLLARLRLYSDSSKIPVCGNRGLSTVAWKDSVMSDIHNLQEPPEEQVTDSVVFLYFILLPNRNISSSTAPVVAQVLLAPHEINRNIFQVFEDCIHIQKKCLHIQRPAQKKSRSRKGGNSTSDELVLEQKDKFVVMLDLLKKNIRNTLSEYQDDISKGGHSSHDILETAADVQAEIMSAAFHECKNLHEFMQDSTRQQFDHNIKWISEAALESSMFPEKLAMQATEACRKRLQSYPSMDSLTVTSPLPLAAADNKKNSIDFDMCDIFQFFNCDGTLKDVPTCPVKLRGRGLCRVDNQRGSKVRWPECQLLRFHDVYYYNSEADYGLEKRYTKVRDRGYFQDTRSSFVSPVKKNQQMKLAHPVSPVRCSPRRTASAQLLMTSSRLDKLQRISPRKQSMSNSTFKQPASHLHSPRKHLSQGTLSSTPEFLQYCGSNSLGHLASEMRKIIPDLATKHNRSLSKSQSEVPTTTMLTGNSTRDHRKRPFTMTPDIACKRDKQLSSLTYPFDVDLSCPVRKSPRRSSVNTNLSANLIGTKKPDSLNDTSFEHKPVMKDTPTSAKMKRSDRHKLKLQRIIDHVLKEKGIEERETIYAACSRNLFNVSMVLLKTLTTSQNLTEEMKTVVYGQVTQIINLEKRRCGVSL